MQIWKSCSASAIQVRQQKQQKQSTKNRQGCSNSRVSSSTHEQEEESPTLSFICLSFCLVSFVFASSLSRCTGVLQHHLQCNRCKAIWMFHNLSPYVQKSACGFLWFCCAACSRALQAPTFLHGACSLSKPGSLTKFRKSINQSPTTKIFPFFFFFFGLASKQTSLSHAAITPVYRSLVSFCHCHRCSL